MVSSRTFEYLSILGFLYLQHHQPERAVTVFRALQAIEPTHPKAARGLALAMLECGDSLGCLRQTDRCRDLAGGALSPAVRILRSRALFGLGRTDEARETLLGE